MEYQLFTFVGFDDSIEMATDDAAGKVNEWLATRQWRTYDGISPYRFTTTVAGSPDGWAVLITVFGPPGKTKTHEPVTGDTVRLG